MVRQPINRKMRVNGMFKAIDKKSKKSKKHAAAELTEEEKALKLMKMDKLFEETLALRRLRWRAAKEAQPIMYADAKALTKITREMMKAAKKTWNKEYQGQYTLMFEPLGTFEEQVESVGEVTMAGFEDFEDSLKEML